MKIVVMTEYFNCDSQFVAEYIHELCTHNEALKKHKEPFLDGKLVTFKSEDPTSDIYAVTSYKLEELK